MPVPDDIKDLLGGGGGSAPAGEGRSLWRRFMDGIKEGAVNSPIGAEPVARSRLKSKGYSDEQINKGERKLIERLARQREIDDQTTFKDVDTFSPANIGKHAVDLLGNIIGGADPTYVVGGPAKSAIGRIATQAGINLGVDTANQGIQIKRGIRDEYDPYQGGMSAAAGVGIQGGAEVARVLRNRGPKSIDDAKIIGDKFGTVTSTLRSPAKNKKVGGAKNSHHLRGNAIDIARGKGVTHSQLEKAYRRAGYEIIESLDEGDHSHFAFKFGGEKKGQPVIEDFDFRPPEEREEISNLLKFPEERIVGSQIESIESLKAKADEATAIDQAWRDRPLKDRWEEFGQVESFKEGQRISSEMWAARDAHHQRYMAEIWKKNVEDIRNAQHKKRERDRAAAKMAEAKKAEDIYWNARILHDSVVRGDNLIPLEKLEAMMPDIDKIRHNMFDPELKSLYEDVYKLTDDARMRLGGKPRFAPASDKYVNTHKPKRKGVSGPDLLGLGKLIDQIQKLTDTLEARGPKRPPREYPAHNDRIDELTPAERQEMDASAPKPPNTNEGADHVIGRGSVATTPVNDLRQPDVAPPPTPPMPPRPGEEPHPDFNPRPGPKGGDGGGVPPVDPEKKLIDALKKAKPLNAEQRKAYHEERSKRSEMLANIQRQGGSVKNYYAQLKSLKGDLPKVDFESIAKDFTDEDFSQLLSKINFSNSLLPYEKVSAQTALMKMLGADGGKLPTAGEIKLLSEIFSRDLVEALLQNRTLAQKMWGGFKNAINMPRALMASFDLSAPFRQGVFLIGRKEWWKSWGTMFRAFGSDKAYEAVMRGIHDHPNYQLMKKSGLAFSDAKSPFLDEREEQFMSNWAEKIPVIGKGVEMSNRAYSAFLNKMRADIFNDLVTKAENLGRDFHHDPKAAKDLARFVNAGTGRGSLGKSGDAAAPFLSGLFFSPRLMASRLTMLNPAFYATLDPLVRKEALKSLAVFSGLTTTVLGVAASAGLDVETDPRSSDFAKIKVGNTRYDILGGFQQYIRLFSQLATGETKTLKGKVKKLDGTKFGQDSRYDVLLRFLRTKFSPVAAYVADAGAGENVIGEEFKPTKDALQSFIPLFAQDLMELYGKEGFGPHLLSGVPAFFGVGVQTYEPKPTKKKNSQVPSDVKDLLGAK